MNRRRALACVGSVLLAGCLSESTPGGSDPAASNATNGTTTTTEQPNTSTGTPASPTLEIPAENHCPSFGESRVVCSVDADDGTTLQMVPSKTRVDLPKATVSFTLRNETGATFTTNYYGWSVSKHVDGEWFHIAPQIVPEPAMMLESGDSHTWTLTIDNTDLDAASARSQGTDDIALVGLGGGTYAFGIDGWFQKGGYENAIGVAARFELNGDDLELAPTADLEVVGRNGDEKRVRQGDGGETFVATRIDESEAEDPRRVLPEEAVRLPALRNLLASFESGVERVRLDTEQTGPFSTDTGVIEYEGETYRITPVDG
ncbi:hypothetical protein [Haladaptatus sp. T7]|uniref:hypothetical protein n=1 Tax=Haladaptatus sp. T7 TaxID=2029368 RepID=UPI0021A2530D|nr:hypothetical protein [Haladaptatus sp. T7]GKZ12371.1 hypothetical protein HAL_02520 [Haladaptatus sp. T7]